MAGSSRCLGILILIFQVFIIQLIYSSPVNISPENVPEILVQSAINSLNANSPTQHTYRGGNLISAQKLVEPDFVIYKLTLNLETVCSEGTTTCPREACAIDLKVDSEDIEVERNSIQCMYLYPQSMQEDIQQGDSNAGEDNNESPSQNTLHLDHEIEATAVRQTTEADKPFIAVRANYNYCPGCPSELNPNIPGLAAFGSQALDMMDRLGHNDFKHKLIRIVRVTRAVPPGLNVVKYELLAEIGESNCLKTTLIDRSQCSLQSNIPSRVCLIKFEKRPCQQSDRRIVANNCTEPSDLENEVNPSLNGNSYLERNGQPERVDSVQEVIGKTAHINQFAEEGKIGTYNSLIDQILESPVGYSNQENNMTDPPSLEEDNSSIRREVDPVTEAPFVKVELEREENERETIPRFVNKQKEFDEFLSDFDLPVRESVVSVTQDDRQPIVEETIRAQRIGEENEEIQAAEDSKRKKRSLTKTSKSERTLVKKLAQKAVDTLDDIDQDDLKRVVNRVLDSKRENIDGILYHLVIEVALTNCNENDDTESDRDCLEKINGPMRICKVQIHTEKEEDPPLSARVVKSECSKETAKGKHSRNKRTPGRTLGAPNSISNEDEDVQNYANLGVQKFSETYQGTNELMLIKISNATKQIVSGSLYKIRITLGTSTCAKGTKENCRLLENGETKECEIRAWSRPWLSEPLDIQVNCDITNPRSRRRREEIVVGAPHPIEITDEIRNYANVGLQKYSSTFNGPNELDLIDISDVSSQVVAGTLYTMKVRFGTTDCPRGVKENCKLLANGETKECEVRAWIRVWLGEGGKQITVNCGTINRRKRSLKGKNYSQKMLQQASYIKNERLFNDFIARYNKTYSSQLERKNRFKIFHQNMMMVQELQRNEQGTAIYGASMFADLTTEEFKKKYLGLRPELRLDNEIPIPMAEIPDIEIPMEYDWRNYNVVTPVKNQGSCGSCWAFSVTGNVEGQYAIRYKNLLSFSEQELVDCDTLDEGCNGGLPDNAYRAIEKLGGLELESDYPYDGENEACHFNKTETRVKVVSAVNITSNETQMAQWLVQNGPISIGINANAMQFYMGGVSHPFKFLCSPSNLDHGVLIVGYGVHTYPIFHKTLPYWTIKNSWGPLWGEQGYYRVYRGDGTCGVNQMASSAIVA